MKKLLSLALALIMLALPLFSQAEEASVNLRSTPPALQFPDFFQPYREQGQAVITDLSFTPGQVLLSSLPADKAPAISDLLKVLVFRVSEQRSDNLSQTGVSLLLDGDSALNFSFANDGKGLYFCSNLLGEKILTMTPDQTESVVRLIIQSAADAGTLPKDQAASLLGLLDAVKDPAAFKESAFGALDLKGFVEVFQSILAGVTMEEVTEPIPELPEAAIVITIPVTKANMIRFMEEAAKLIWSIPFIQQMSANGNATVSIKGEKKPMTQESLTELLTMFPGMMKEDSAIKIYADATGSHMYITSSAALVNGENELTLTYSLTTTRDDKGFRAVLAETVTSVESTLTLNGDIQVTYEGKGGNLVYLITSNLTPAQGTAFQPLEMNFTGSWAIAKDAFDAAISGTMTARNDAESPAVPIFLSATSSQKDLGDHAEGQETLSMSVEGVGDLYSLTVQRKTELAEAYITSPDAVEIAALDTAGMNALGSEIKQNATGVFLGILMKLPPSVLKLLMKNTGK